jgi:hypothetical protein
MIHQSTRDDSRMVDELYIKRVLCSLVDLFALLSCLILLDSKASYNFETASTFVLS